MYKPGCGPDTRLDQVPEHFALFCYGVANELPGREKNGKGPFGVRSLNRETRDDKNKKNQKI
jgi:hypothetical protein